MIKTEHPGVYLLKNGRYKLKVTNVCPRTKKRSWKRKVMPEGSTIKDALAMRDQIKAQMIKDEESTPQRIMLAGYAKDWIQTKKARLKPRAYTTYVSALSHHVLPQLGNIYVDAIKRADVEAWVVWAEARTMNNGEPYATTTLKGWWRVLKLLLQDAAADFGIADPTLRVRPPTTYTGPRRELRTLTHSQLHDVLAQMDKVDIREDDDYTSRGLEARMLAFTGMRVGELYGLHWEDISDEMLTVRHSASAGTLTDTKTHSPRQVYLPPELQEALFVHRQKLIATQHPGLSSGLVFPSNQGTPRHPAYLTKLLKEAAGICGIDVNVTPQVLRRTYNTLLVAAGVDRIVLRAQMGHTTEAMTERYAGVPLAQKKAAHLKVFKMP